MHRLRPLDQLCFDNTYARLPEAFYARAAPTPLKTPFLVSFNRDAAALIDLDPEAAARPEFLEYASGARLLPGSEPLAMLYAGHQFGHYVPQLGDGRAILLGEVRNGAGEKWDLHLKGSGLTLFSRDGDGRAVLRSTIREYLCSEAMHGLGIPTTRALCVIGSEEPVLRETVETGAMLVRLAPSHVRFGTFEVFYYRRQYERVRELADYVLEQHYAHLAARPDRYAAMLREVAVRTGILIARWQAVGFAHGVMNSDNMSILGLTLDYGPFGFLDDYNPRFICNHSDHHGRYAFDHQPDIGYFNLRCLAQALQPLVPDDDARAALEAYEAAFTETYWALMRDKLGLTQARPGDQVLIGDLLHLLQVNRADYTNFFRALGEFGQGLHERNEPLRDFFLDRPAFDAWAGRYRERLLAEGSEDAARKTRMDRVNPKYVLRNYLAETAIRRAATEGDASEIERLREVLRDPYAEQPEMERYAASPPDWGREVVVSCSS